VNRRLKKCMDEATTSADIEGCVTQLIGRILRQPGARKTGVRELDESYVYFTKGDTRPMLDKVAAGFQQEGMEDLVGRIAVSGGESENKRKTVRIKDSFKKHEHAFFLPVWVMVNGKNTRRRFSYHADIKSNLDFSKFKVTPEIMDTVKNSLSSETREKTTYAVTISEEKKTVIQKEGTIQTGKAPLVVPQ